VSIPNICIASRLTASSSEGEVTMQKQWKLEMHYPGGGEDSLITTDSFDDFAEVERKIKPGNGFCRQTTGCSLDGRLANARRSEKIRIENRATVTEDDALLRK